jgi:hypothetical protein
MTMVAPDTPAPAPSPQESTETKLLAQAEGDVKGQLKDPTSAKFKATIVSVSGVCAIGQVLAKNSFGGFEGYQEFVWHDGSVYFQGSQFSKSYFDRWNACMTNRVADTDAMM